MSGTVLGTRNARRSQVKEERGRGRSRQTEKDTGSCGLFAIEGDVCVWGGETVGTREGRG